MSSSAGAEGTDDPLQTLDRDAFMGRVVASTLEPVVGGLALLFLAIAGIQRFAMAPPFPTVMAPYSVGMSLLFGALYGAIRVRGIPPPWAHVAGTGIVLLVLTGTVLPFALVRDPLQTTDLVLLAMGTGAVFLSRRWFLLNLAVVVAVFGAFVALTPGYARWPNLGVAVMSGGVLGYVVLCHRARILTSLQDLRAQEADQRQELEDRMARIEELRQEAERERDRAERYAVQLEDTNEDLHRFARTLSRHLQAPVRRARRRLDGDDGDGEPARPEEALGELRDLDDTLEALRDYAGLAEQESDLSPLELQEVVVAAWRETAADLGLDPDPLRVGELPEVVGDRDLLARLFRELFGNALRHGEAPISVTASREGGAVRVVVEDRGPGLDPDQADEVFRLLEGEDGRPGMGLALARRAAERLGGDVAADPSADGGRFVVTLQAVDRIRSPAVDAPTPREGRTAGGGIRSVGDGAAT